VNPVRLLKNRINRVRHGLRSEVSYAQCGEDLIIAFAARSLGFSTLTYLDIGAHHPVYLSNTYYFYLQGGRGLCVEPDSALLPPFERLRPGDRVLRAGVGAADGTAEFFVMSTPTLNTFSKEEAERYASYGTHAIERREQIEIIEINRLLREHCPAPQLVSLDVEGLDYEILRAFDFQAARPPIFCIETITYSEDGRERKIGEIIERMQAQDYFVYADTWINTIFIDRAAWSRRPAARKSP